MGINFSKRNVIKYGIIVTVIYFLISSVSNDELLDTLLILPGLILALTFHEFSHARMADRLGDPTPSNQGRITLNPLAHIDLTGMACLLIAGFGWGKPVQINSTYFRNPSRDNMLVALAGPVSNFILAFLSFLAYGLLYFFIPLDKTWGEILITMVSLCAYINLSLGLFNLLPFPPLDGSKILSYFLKGKAQSFLWSLERYSFLILAILFITELPKYIISPAISYIGNGMLSIVEKIIVPFI